MLQQILDNIEGILIELKDNDINFEFDVKDKRLNMFRMDINLRKSLSQYKVQWRSETEPSWWQQAQWGRNYFDPEYFFGENGKMFNYISEALLTLDAYLKKIGMNVKVHCRNKDYENGFSVTMEEFTKINPKGLDLVIIGITKDHRTPKLEKRINSYSQFINEAFDKNSIKDFCERYLAYLLDDENFSIDLTVPKRGGTSFWTNSEGPRITISKKGDLIRWNTIKDHMIPFLTILNKEYNCFPDIDFNGLNTTLVTHRIYDLIKDFAVTNRPFNKIVISLRSNQNKFRAKRLLTEELKDITTNVSGSGRKEVSRIYNDEDANIKSPAAGILLNHKFRKEEMDSIITTVQKSVKPKDLNTKDPKLQRILILMNNLQFLKDTLQDKGRLQCEYCGKGPLIIYDVAPDKFNKLIDNPYYKLNKNFDPEWGATCDHKDPQSLGGDKFDYSNLAVCCNRCNQRKKSIPYSQWMEMIGKTNENLVVPRQPINQMTDTFIIEVFDKFNIDYCKPEDIEKMDFVQEAYWTFLFEDRDGKGGFLEKPYEQFLEICWLDSELYTNVMNELIAVKSMVEKRTGYSYNLKHSTNWVYGFITIETRDIYGNFLRPENNI